MSFGHLPAAFLQIFFWFQKATLGTRLALNASRRPRLPLIASRRPWRPSSMSFGHLPGAFLEIFFWFQQATLGTRLALNASRRPRLPIYILWSSSTSSAGCMSTALFCAACKLADVTLIPRRGKHTLLILHMFMLYHNSMPTNLQRTTSLNRWCGKAKHIAFPLDMRYQWYISTNEASVSWREPPGYSTAHLSLPSTIKAAKGPIASDSERSDTLRLNLDVFPPAGSKAESALAACIPCFTAEQSSRILLRASQINRPHFQTNSKSKPSHNKTAQTPTSCHLQPHPATQSYSQQNPNAKTQIALAHDPPWPQAEPQPLRSTSSWTCSPSPVAQHNWHEHAIRLPEWSPSWCAPRTSTSKPPQRSQRSPCVDIQSTTKTTQRNWINCIGLEPITSPLSIDIYQVLSLQIVMVNATASGAPRQHVPLPITSQQHSYAQTIVNLQPFRPQTTLYPAPTRRTPVNLTQATTTIDPNAEQLNVSTAHLHASTKHVTNPQPSCRDAAPGTAKRSAGLYGGLRNASAPEIRAWHPGPPAKQWWSSRPWDNHQKGRPEKHFDHALPTPPTKETSHLLSEC